VDTVHECDRQTDRRTDRITITDTVQTASHGKNCTLARIFTKLTSTMTFGKENERERFRGPRSKINVTVEYRPTSRPIFTV